MTIDMIPLNHLVPSKANVRKTGASAGLEELAASIEAHGLLQNLQVRRSEKGKFEVIAGGRRLAAMNILRRLKKLAKDFPVPCHVQDGQDAEEISLAENTVRLAMHPADQFLAFQGLTEQGKGVEDIAARFGVSPEVVRKRLKLASVSPVLIGVYRDEQMSLDQLMAFTVSDDHAAQEAVWFNQPEWNRRPDTIRASLTAAQVQAHDRRVRFVGLDTYRAAGGGMNRDLFQPEHEGYLTDPALLDGLVAEKLEQEAAGVRGEGWAWVEIMPVRDHAALAGMGRVRPVAQPLDEAAQEIRDRLMAEYDALIAEHGEDPDEDVSEQLNALWQQIETIEQGTVAWKPDDLVRAGAVLSLDYDGDLMVDRGLVRPDDMRRIRQAESGEEAEDAPLKSAGLSAALIESLTAERTAALRALTMDNQAVALASLCHALALGLFYGYGASEDACLQVRLTSRNLAVSGASFDASRAGVLLSERHEAWAKRLPPESYDLSDWLIAQEPQTVLDLLAYCAAQSMDAVQVKADIPSLPRLLHAKALAATLGLDMRDWWSPTKERYLGRVSKAAVLEVVREGVSTQAAENMAGLKKDRLIEAAERRLEGTGWLPALFRMPDAAQAELGDSVEEAA